MYCTVWSFYFRVFSNSFAVYYDITTEYNGFMSYIHLVKYHQNIALSYILRLLMAVSKIFGKTFRNEQMEQPLPLTPDMHKLVPVPIQCGTLSSSHPCTYINTMMHTSLTDHLQAPYKLSMSLALPIKNPNHQWIIWCCDSVSWPGIHFPMGTCYCLRPTVYIDS